MSTSPGKAELDELFAPSIESMIAKGVREEFLWERSTLTTHLPFDPTTLEVLFRLNLPKVILRRDCNFDEVFFTDYSFGRTIKFTCRLHDQTKSEGSPSRLSLTIRQSDGYVNAVKTMSEALRGKERKTRSEYVPAKGSYGNYNLENRQATAFIWVRFTTVVELQLTSPDSDTDVMIDARGLATALDEAMKDHEGPTSTVPKGCIYGAFIPARFTIGNMELLSFEFSPSTDSNREFAVK